TYSSSPKSVD
ncbi:type VI secretion-associated protein, partial [Vibrio parahaemolyticus V-223/04]